MRLQWTASLVVIQAPAEVILVATVKGRVSIPPEMTVRTLILVPLTRACVSLPTALLRASARSVLPFGSIIL